MCTLKGSQLSSSTHEACPKCNPWLLQVGLRKNHVLNPGDLCLLSVDGTEPDGQCSDSKQKVAFASPQHVYGRIHPLAITIPLIHQD